MRTNKDGKNVFKMSDILKLLKDQNHNWLQSNHHVFSEKKKKKKL